MHAMIKSRFVDYIYIQTTPIFSQNATTQDHVCSVSLLQILTSPGDAAGIYTQMITSIFWLSKELCKIEMPQIRIPVAHVHSVSLLSNVDMVVHICSVSFKKQKENVHGLLLLSNHPTANPCLFCLSSQKRYRAHFMGCFFS